MSRTTVLIDDHLQPIIDHLTTVLGTLSYPVAVGDGERPIDTDKKFIEPPYITVHHIVGGTMDGPLNDTQADVSLRIAIVSFGNTAKEARVLRDIVHAELMDKSNFSITNRRIRDIRLEVPSDGAYRDDDVQTPIFYERQIYLLNTTPS